MPKTPLFYTQACLSFRTEANEVSRSEESRCYDYRSYPRDPSVANSPSGLQSLYFCKELLDSGSYKWWNHTTPIVTNKKRGIPYTGITNDLIVRTRQHKRKIIKGFSSRYNLDKLVWFEEFVWVHDAIAREKEIKGWSRQKKIELIESFNPEWKDLYYDLV